jgi:hypothetical protein
MTTFTADQVWGCAAAAQRINEGYFKEDQWMPNATPPYVAKRANKALVKEWLRTNNFVEVTEADIAAGREARNHFKGYTLLAIAGKLNDFQTTAMRIAAKDEFTGRDMYDFAVVSCLPEAAIRGAARQAVNREIFASDQLAGNVGDKIRGEVIIVNSWFKAEYNSWKTTGRMGESYVDFWFKHELQGTVAIEGKIKQHRSNKTTQLHYVKKV